MKITHYISILLAVAVVCGCTKSNENVKLSETQLTITAGFAEDNTKTTLQDDGTKVYWEPADQVKLFYNGTSGLFIAQCQQIASVSQFSGTLGTIIGFDEGFSDETPLWGLYPYREDATSDNTSITTTLPSNQRGRAGSFANGANISVGRSNSLSMGFYNICGGLRFSVTNSNLTEVVFEGLNNEDLAGTIKIQFEEGIPVVKELSNGQKKLTLRAPDGETFEVGKWYYITALPNELTKGFRLTFNTADQCAKLTKETPVTIKRGIFGSIAEADNGLSFEDRTDVSDIITFACPVVKYACVSKYDTDEDGEISKAEAAAVTSIEGLFNNWDTESVTSFDELEYFTGITSLSYIPRKCPNLQSIVIPAGVTKITNNDFYNYNETYHKGHTSIQSVKFTLPSSVNHIDGYAFFECTALKEIKIPDSVTSIGNYAFWGCTSLESATLPSNLSSMPYGIFGSCYNLQEVIFPDNLITIDGYAFHYCHLEKNGISKIDLPSTVTTIGDGNFNCVRNVVITSSKMVTIGSETFGQHTKIYVPANKKEMYKVSSNWSNHADFIYSIEEYTGDTAPEGTVDMGMDVFWSTCNLGASSPENYGDYYAWGETEPYYESLNPLVWKEGKSSGYNESNYMWCNGSLNEITKYCETDKLRVLEKSDDAASQILGNNFYIPRKSDWETLNRICQWQKTSQGGCTGYAATSTATGNSIFLPGGGVFSGTSMTDNGNCWYWASNVCYNNSGSYKYYKSAYIWNDPGSYSAGYYLANDYRTKGLNIRPVAY